MKTTTAMLLASLLLPATLSAADSIEEAITTDYLTTQAITQTWSDSPFPIEIHTREQIERSSANTLYEYLGTRSSLNVTPSYGNPFSQLLDLRGFGTTNGYENLVVRIDGRKISNIDGVPPMLSAIPLNQIQRIEIIRGAGSVQDGDGANGGAIHIYTRRFSGMEIATVFGSDGNRNAELSLGHIDERFTIQGSLSTQEASTNRLITADSRRDSQSSHQGDLSVSFFPIQDLWVQLSLQALSQDLFYPNALESMSAYHDDPSMMGISYDGGLSAYTHQTIGQETYVAEMGYPLSDSLEANLLLDLQNKRSKYVAWGSRYDYTTVSLHPTLHYRADHISADAGFEYRDGKRDSGDESTFKRNRGIYLQGSYDLGDHQLSAGIRHENIQYRHEASAQDTLEDDENHWGLELGYRYQIHSHLNLFASAARSYQSPNIDNFFTVEYDNVTYEQQTVFNGFIETMRATTYQIGVQSEIPNGRYQLALFQIDANDEIYLYKDAANYIYNNTNLDETRKRGVELSFAYRIHNVEPSFRYTWLDSTILHEDEGNGAYDGRDLPGVSRHNLSASVDIDLAPQWRVNLHHVYRSSAYAAEDFANSFEHKQPVYQRSDAKLSYENQRIRLFVACNNLFDRQNAYVVSDSAIYPFDYERRFSAGFAMRF